MEALNLFVWGERDVPLQFLKAYSESGRTRWILFRETSIGCGWEGWRIIRKNYYIYNNCKHQDAYKETGHKPSVTRLSAGHDWSMMFLTANEKAGVFNTENLTPTIHGAIEYPWTSWQELHDVIWNWNNELWRMAIIEEWWIRKSRKQGNVMLNLIQHLTKSRTNETWNKFRLTNGAFTRHQESKTKLLRLNVVWISAASRLKLSSILNQHQEL